MVGGWRLVAAGGWRLVAVGGWWLAVDGPLGRSLKAVLNKKKSSPLRTPLLCRGPLTRAALCHQSDLIRVVRMPVPVSASAPLCTPVSLEQYRRPAPANAPTGPRAPQGEPAASHSRPGLCCARPVARRTPPATPPNREPRPRPTERRGVQFARGGGHETTGGTPGEGAIHRGIRGRQPRSPHKPRHV